MVWQKVIPLVLLSGCVAMSPNLEFHEDLVTGQEYYSFELGVSYPKKEVYDSGRVDRIPPVSGQPKGSTICYLQRARRN